MSRFSKSGQIFLVTDEDHKGWFQWRIGPRRDSLEDGVIFEPKTKQIIPVTQADNIKKFKKELSKSDIPFVRIGGKIWYLGTKWSLVELIRNIAHPDQIKAPGY